MSLLLASGSSQYLERAGIPSVSFPYAISAWVFITVSANGNIVGLFNNGTLVDFEELVFVAPDTVQLRADDGGTSGNSAAVGISLNTWHHVLGLWTSSSGRRIYLDGVAGTNLASAITPSGLNTTAAGRQSTSTPGNFIDARIAEFTVWDLSTDLTANEITMLALGVTSTLVRFAEIVEYHPLLQDLDPTLELIASNGLTQFGGPIASGHPPLILSAAPFVHTASTSIEISVGNTITFIQVAWDNRIERTLNNTVTFGNSVNINKVVSVSIGNTIAFNQFANNTIEETVGNTVTLGNSIARGEQQNTNVIFFNTVSIIQGGAGNNQVTFGNSASVSKEISLSVGNTVTFGNTTIGVGDPNCEINEYNPSGPLVLSPPTLSVRDFITFSFSSFTIDLRNPRFGDSITVAPRRAFNTSRNGTPRIFRKSTWPNKRDINITVHIVLEADKAALLIFLENSLGQLVSYVDPETRTWDGVILNPETAIAQLTDVGTCTEYEVSIAFRGEPDDL